MHIFVGSTNPVKINAVTQATSEAWPDVTVHGVDVPSGISAQPRSDEETRRGASNRAMAALDDGLKQLHLSQEDQPEALGVGLEGGVFKNEDGELWSTVWAVVVDTEGTVFESNGARFKIPDELAAPIKAGGEMGPVMDSLAGRSDIKRTSGAIGVITNNFVDRTEEYSGIVKMAIGLWYGRQWNKNLSRAS